MVVNCQWRSSSSGIGNGNGVVVVMVVQVTKGFEGSALVSGTHVKFFLCEKF